jgi:hypothetical protein
MRTKIASLSRQKNEDAKGTCMRQAHDAQAKPMIMASAADYVCYHVWPYRSNFAPHAYRFESQCFDAGLKEYVIILYVKRVEHDYQAPFARKCNPEKKTIGSTPVSLSLMRVSQ